MWYDVVIFGNEVLKELQATGHYKNMPSHKVYNMLCSLCLQGHKYIYWQKVPGDPCQNRIIIHFLKIVLRRHVLFIPANQLFPA